MANWEGIHGQFGGPFWASSGLVSGPLWPPNRNSFGARFGSYPPLDEMAIQRASMHAHMLAMRGTFVYWLWPLAVVEKPHGNPNYHTLPSIAAVPFLAW